MFSTTLMSLIIILSIVVMLHATILSKKSYVYREKSSPFECGFDPMSSSRLPFSLNCFLITIIIFIFEVEIALILPMILIMNYSNLFMWTITSIICMLILLLGSYHEWIKNIKLIK